VNGTPLNGAVITVVVNTATFTSTSTSTATPTPTSTLTASFTATSTATATHPVVQVAAGSAPPSNQTLGQGSSNVPVFQVNVTNQSGETVQLTGATLTASGTGNSATGVSSLSVYEVVGGTPVLVGTVSSPFATSNNLTVSLPNINVPAGSSQTFLVTYNFSSTAAPGTYTVSLANAGALAGQGLTSGKSIQVNGAPVNGAVLTVVANTATPTTSFTATVTPTVTQVVLYPNPSTGGPVNLLVPGSGTATVKVQIFTTAFRKVQERDYPNIPLGTTGNGPTVDMTDNWGDPLASGLYYVVVTTTPQQNSGGQSQRFIGKLLLLR